MTTEYHVLKLFLHPIITKWAVINQSTHPHTLHSYLHSYLPISPLSASFHFLSHSPVFSLAWHWGSGSVTSSQQRFVSLGGFRRISANMIWNPQLEIGRFLQTLLALTRLCEVQHFSLSERQTTCKDYNQTQRSVGWCQFEPFFTLAGSYCGNKQPIRQHIMEWICSIWVFNTWHLTETMDQLGTLKRSYKRISKISDAQYMWYRQHYECVRHKFGVLKM